MLYLFINKNENKMNQLKVTIEEPFTNNGKEYDVIIKAEVSVNCIAGESIF